MTWRRRLLATSRRKRSFRCKAICSMVSTLPRLPRVRLQAGHRQASCTHRPRPARSQPSSELGMHYVRAEDVQPHCLRLKDLRLICVCCRQRQARHRVGALALNPQRLSTGRDDANCSTRPSTAAASSAHAMRQCSQLSITSSTERALRNSLSRFSMGLALSGLTPIDSATASATSLWSVKGARSVHHTPSLNRARKPPAASSASLVFPHPPAPINVSSRCSSRMAATSANSPSRPMKFVSGSGRLSALRFGNGSEAS